MPLSLVTPPTEEPVTLADACAHLRVGVGDDDATVSALVTAARQHLDGADGILGRAICTQTWRLTLDALPRAGVRLPLLPVASVASIEYVDGDGATHPLAADQYTLTGSRIVPAYGVTWPTPRAQADAVTVEFVAGYGGAADVPGPIKQAILLLVGHWYDNRSAINVGNIVQEIPLAVNALIAPYRNITFG